MELDGKLGTWVRNNGSTAFVLVGMLLIGVSVLSVQTQQRLYTEAANEENADADAWGIWFEPSYVRLDKDGVGYLRVKLSALDQTMENARLGLTFDPLQLEIVDIINGTVFPTVEKVNSGDKVILTSTGSFFGTGTWVTLKVKLQPGVTLSYIETSSDLSQVRYESGISRGINHTRIEVGQ